MVMKLFQLTAARRRLGKVVVAGQIEKLVSTHSRPKAAGSLICAVLLAVICFNSQPPEGGWFMFDYSEVPQGVFQLTAARRRLGECGAAAENHRVSTHSRPKAAGCWQAGAHQAHHRFNSQPPEGGWGRGQCGLAHAGVSTHSRPKAAGLFADFTQPPTRGFNSQPPEGGWVITRSLMFRFMVFQLTAARRRLALTVTFTSNSITFQLTAARRRLDHRQPTAHPRRLFQLTAARRRLELCSL